MIWIGEQELKEIRVFSEEDQYSLMESVNNFLLILLSPNIIYLIIHKSTLQNRLFYIDYSIGYILYIADSFVLFNLN